MTQRIFKAECNKDVTDLWRIISKDIVEVWNVAGISVAIHKERMQSPLHIKIDWGNLIEIKRPVDYSKYIGKLGYFGSK